MRRLSPCLLFLLAGTATAADLRYELDWDEAAQSMRVRLCSDTPAASRYFSLDRGAEVYLSELKRNRGTPPAQDGSQWVATGWQAGDCLEYRAALGRIADRQNPDAGFRVGKDLLSVPQQWLLRTRSRQEAEVSLRLPEGVELSAPWRMLPRQADGLRRYRIPATPANWAANVAIGHFPQYPVKVNNTTLRVSILGDVTTGMRERLRDWIATIARAAESAYGALPVTDVQVLLLPVGSSRGRAVGFGQSTRGQGNALMLLIDPSRPIAEFRDDWTAVHEISHLFHPYLGDEGSWLAEGLASYWQNVLRARAGMLSADEAWQRLDAGFGRGKADPSSGTSLADLVSTRRGRNAYMRIYWSGAAYWLRVDSELRRRDPRLGIDLALRRFRDCCLAERREWNPVDFVAKLDQLLATDVFVSRFREAVAAREFPPLADVYETLGLHRIAAGDLRFDDSAAARELRHAIMRPDSAGRD